MVKDLDNYEKFKKIQIERIEKEKWIEGEATSSDLGDLFIMDWIYNNAKMFRDQWNNSLCKNCLNCFICGYNVISACDIYQEDKQ